MRRITLVLLVFSLSVFRPFLLYPQEKTAIKTVVIDAGHGGKDPGTIGQTVQEKRITLAIALKLGRLIRANYQHINVIYTRDKDEFIELHERAAIANRNKADLFISIHCNANPVHSLHGVETYVMGLHRSEANLDIAKKENSSILMEPDYTRNYNGFDPNSDESYITFTLFQNAYLDQSTAFAATIQDELKERGRLDDRGVHQAGFLVLYKTTMPSVLVETGFLSNPEEEKFLNSESGQEYIAAAIFKAFDRFRNSLEKQSLPALSGSKTPTGYLAPPSSGSHETLTGSKPQISLQPPPSSGSTPRSVCPALQNPEAYKIPQTPRVWFCIQVASEPKDIGIHNKRFEGLPDVRMYRHQGMYKYTTGLKKTVDEALKLLDSVKKLGFHDAFVVAFNRDERITIEEARKIMSGGEKNK